jgi:Ca2+-binding EF-hand superfamily protein
MRWILDYSNSISWGDSEYMTFPEIYDALRRLIEQRAKEKELIDNG